MVHKKHHTKYNSKVSGSFGIIVHFTHDSVGQWQRSSGTGEEF
jgi:hypothetical protein